MHRHKKEDMVPFKWSNVSFYVRRYYMRIITTMIISMFSVISSNLLPQVEERMVNDVMDSIIKNDGQEGYDHIIQSYLWIFTLLAFLPFFQSVISVFIVDLWKIRKGAEFQKRLFEAFLTKHYHCDPAEYNVRAKQLNLYFSLNDIFSEIFVHLANICISFIFLIRYDKILTLIVLSFVPIEAFVRIVLGPKFSVQFKKLQEMQVSYENHSVNILRRHFIFRHLHTRFLESKFMWDHMIKPIMMKNRKVFLWETGIGWFMGFVGVGIEVGKFMYTINLLLVERSITLGAYVAIQSYVPILVDSMGKLVGIIQKWIQWQADIAKVSDMFDPNIKIQEIDDERVPHFSYPLRIISKGFEFTYNNTATTINIPPFQISGGQHVLVCGDNGSGKSSLMRMLIRDNTIPHHCLYINGVDLNQHIQTDHDIYYAPQSEPLWFEERTIYENITYGNERVEEQLIQYWVREMGLSAFDIHRSYDNLSGGEKQRLLMIRACIAPQPIIILDEPTSEWSHEGTHEFITKYKYEMFQGKTLIVIMHVDSNKYENFFNDIIQF